MVAHFILSLVVGPLRVCIDVTTNGLLFLSCSPMLLDSDIRLGTQLFRVF